MQPSEMQERFLKVETALQMSRDTGESVRLERQDRRLVYLERIAWGLAGATGLMEGFRLLRDLGVLPK